jgi:hypothetical protein
LKFGQPVRVLERPATGDKRVAVVEVLRLALDGGRATVELRYEVEGLRVRAELTRGSAGWSIASFDLAERWTRPSLGAACSPG